MAKLLGRCPNCQGNLFIDGEDVKCLQCGWTKVGVKERQLWYQANRPDMIKDLVAMSNSQFLNKWQVPAQLIGHLKTDKLYAELAGKPPAAKRGPKPAPAPAAVDPAPAAAKPTPAPSPDGRVLFTITERDFAMLTDNELSSLYSVIGQISAARIKDQIKEAQVCQRR